MSQTFAQAPAAVADSSALKPSQFEIDPIEEDDREFRDFVESISLGPEELAAFLAAPELSTAEEARRLFTRRPNIRA